MTNSLEDDIQRIIASMDNEEQQSQEQEPQPEETIHIHYFPDAIVILKEDEKAQVVDSTQVIPQKVSFLPAYLVCLLYLLLPFFCIAFQAYEIFDPPIATVTIIPKSQTVTLTGTLQLGRVLPPLTISQSQTVPTTGRGHQDARNAAGFITFYNGQLTSVTVAAGTVLTAANGVQVITDENAYIPAEKQTIPPTLGQATVSAHALVAGSQGNIPTGDINQSCCAPSILAQNTTAFHGGQDERNFQTVAKRDIENTTISPKTILTQSERGALEGQVKPTEQLFMLPCTPTQTSDHKIGQEATQVNITVSETCSAVAYNREALEQKATDLLTRQAATKLGTNYSNFGAVQVSVMQATITPPIVFLSFKAQGTWIYGLSSTAQEQIKKLIAGKTKQEALQILASLPGTEKVSISWGEDSRLSKNTRYIHLVVLIHSI